MLFGLRSSKPRPVASHSLLNSLRSFRISSIKMLDSTQTLRNFGRYPSFSSGRQVNKAVTSSFERVLPLLVLGPLSLPGIWSMTAGSLHLAKRSLGYTPRSSYLPNQSSKQIVIYSTLFHLSLVLPSFGLIAHENCAGCDLSPHKPCVSTDLEIICCKLRMG